MIPCGFLDGNPAVFFVPDTNRHFNTSILSFRTPFSFAQKGDLCIYFFNNRFIREGVSFVVLHRIRVAKDQKLVILHAPHTSEVLRIALAPTGRMRTNDLYSPIFGGGR